MALKAGAPAGHPRPGALRNHCTGASCRAGVPEPLGSRSSSSDGLAPAGIPGAPAPSGSRSSSSDGLGPAGTRVGAPSGAPLPAVSPSGLAGFWRLGTVATPGAGALATACPASAGCATSSEARAAAAAASPAGRLFPAGAPRTAVLAATAEASPAGRLFPAGAPRTAVLAAAAEASPAGRLFPAGAPRTAVLAAMPVDDCPLPRPTVGGSS